VTALATSVAVGGLGGGPAGRLGSGGGIQVSDLFLISRRLMIEISREFVPI